MTAREAIVLLERELLTLREETHVDLVRRMSAGALRCQRSGETGTQYQLEIKFLWDDKPGGNIRVVGSIDDGALRGLPPLTRSFIKA